MAQRKPAAAPALATPPTRRSARLNQPLPAAAATAPSKTAHRITKTKAAAKPKPQKYDCTTCGRTLAASSFPQHLATDQCNHLINTCKQCMKAWIAAQLDSTTYDKLSCPECPETMANAGVKTMATKEVYARYDELERRGIAEKIPGWRWCLNPKCMAGQVHEPLLKAAIRTAQEGEEVEVIDGDEWTRASTARTFKRSKAKKPAGRKKTFDLTQDDNDIFVCHDCGKKACVPCDRPWHDGETCAQYQKHQKHQTETEEKATQKLIKSQCKQCPKCSKNIEKNGGCDQVMCTQCATAFCWRCLVDYTVINKSGHGKGWAYARAGAIDPHAAPNAPGNWGGGFWQNAQNAVAAAMNR